MNAVGHELVARVAWNAMTDRARKEVTALVAEPQNPRTGVPTSERDNDVFTYTTYMDNVRPALSPLHFVNTPLSGDGSLDGTENSVEFYKQMVQVLQSASATKSEKAEALRLSGHLVGDIHQPLHNSDNGDRGGNSLKLAGRDNLHSYWDRGGGAWPRKATPEEQSELVEALGKSYPVSDLGDAVQELDPAQWSREGWQLSKSQVYFGIKAGLAPSKAYGEKTAKTMAREIVLAGNRWAKQLNVIFA